MKGKVSKKQGHNYSTEQLMAYSEQWLEKFIARFQKENAELRERLAEYERKFEEAEWH